MRQNQHFLGYGPLLAEGFALYVDASLSSSHRNSLKLVWFEATTSPGKCDIPARCRHTPYRSPALYVNHLLEYPAKLGHTVVFLGCHHCKVHAGQVSCHGEC